MKSGDRDYSNIVNYISKLDSVIVAFSGGVDSTLVLKASYDALKEKTVAVTADSPSVPKKELEETKKIAKNIGAKHIIIKTKETQNKNYIENPKNRCYYCKSELYSKLKELSKNLNIKNILNGTNLDDLGDFRPGLAAAEEFKVVSPLKDLKIKKEDVRKIAKSIGLEIWNKPASPCLSSRIPYGQKVTLEKLSMIEKAEDFLKDLNITELRVRHFGSKARIEVNDSEKPIIEDNFSKISNKFSQIGFSKIEIMKFKSGNLNINVQAAN